MEYDVLKDSPEEKERKRKALSEKYKEKSFFEKKKKAIIDWWEDQGSRTRGEWGSKKK
jgi:hypothetical protein